LVIKSQQPNSKNVTVHACFLWGGSFGTGYIYITGVFFKFGVEVGVELSIVNARITDQLFKSYALHEWRDLNRLSNAYFDAKFKKTPFTFL
jgi:hypothetical protein